MEKRDVITALGRARLSGCDRGALAEGIVQDVVIEGDRVRVILFDRIGGAPVPEAWVDALRNAAASVPGVGEVRVERRPAGSAAAAAPAPVARARIEVEARVVVAVASGKGGVGKSTVTANLAHALARTGLRVGALDADIYGFSLPTLLGAAGEPRKVGPRRLAPVQAHGVRLISMDHFVRENAAVVWRGPLLGKALQQFLRDVEWGELDVLLLDLPPGTGDVALDVHELLPASAELVVTTPDPLAARVAVRAGRMALETGHQVLGVVENMSYLRCPHGEVLRPFGTGGGEQVATTLGAPLLAHIGLGSPKLPGGGLFDPRSEAGRTFADLAARLAQAAVAVA
jgi:ATP-binding protein involved in chromosome partitioning